MFTIIRLDTAEPLENDKGEAFTYETGKEAVERAKDLTKCLGVKCQPRRVVVDSSWHEREQGRFKNGQYEIPAWEKHTAWFTKVYQPAFYDYDRKRGLVWNERYTRYYDDSPSYAQKIIIDKKRDTTYKVLEAEFKLRISKNHFAHVSLSDPMMIAFTKNDEMGLADRQTRMSPEAYLTRYWHDLLNDEDIASLVELHNETYAAGTFQLATTPDEIEHVYTVYDESCEGVNSSCMRYPKWEFSEHPCRVYGAGDLAIAYLTNDKGETTHRALCWPEKKLYSRMYGRGDKLHVRLKAAGYSKSRYYSQSNPAMEGARILKIPAENCKPDVYVMPYFDEPGCIKPSGEYFEIVSEGRFGYATQETNGTTDDEPQDDIGVCEECGERTDELFTVYTNDRRTSSVGMCECCRDNHAFFCDATEEYYDNREVDSYEVEGETWCARAFN